MLTRTHNFMKRSVLTELLAQVNTQMTDLLFQDKLPGIVYFCPLPCPQYSHEKHDVHMESQSLLCVNNYCWEEGVWVMPPHRTEKGTNAVQ